MIQGSDLDRRLAFLNRADRLKTLPLATALTDGSRRETRAEQCWHLALWALVFEDTIRDWSADPDRVIQLCLLHDLPRVMPRDPLSAPDDDLGAAASALFGLLPDTQGAELTALWRESHGGQSPDAKAARRLRRAQPLFQELYAAATTSTDRDMLMDLLTTGRAAALASDWPELHAHASALLHREPSSASADLHARLSFLVEADALKTVERGTPILDGSRRERSGEHSWHIALYALTLGEHASVPAEIARVIRMLLIHDIVEIDAGDSPIHGDHDTAALEQAEARAARRLFGLLPEVQGYSLRSL